MCAVYFRKEIFEGILLVIMLFSAIMNGAMLPPLSHTVQEVHLVRRPTQISQSYFAPGLSLMI